ncbi:MAG: CoA transferase subunit A [Anaerostipes sp.]|jgi:acetate CoA/acetoacetate CoA-transferase alpha subunit|nr:CoA transferase subunit A [Anaerostipes sp.]MDD3745730.1 CoA transferase subunit A [Anaerostipes sp.]
MDKIINIETAMSFIHDESVLMIGGFLSNGTPEHLMDAIVEKGYKDLTVIANDSGLNEKTGIGKLISAKLVKNLIASHIGTNPETGRQMSEGTLNVTLVPQGTLAEQVRAGGVGLGGILTPTGVGTEVAKGKNVIVIDGKEYLLEKPLKADVALIRGTFVDEAGNIYYDGTTKNFNPLMAQAADTVIAVAEKIVPTGEINPNHVMTPGIFVDYILEEE